MPRRFRRLNKKYVLVALAAGLVILALAIYMSRPSRKTASTIPSSAAPSTTVSKDAQPSPQSSTSTPTTSSSSSSTAKSSINSAPANSNLTLIDPWGDFVSNHKPGQNGSPTTETSACNTTPGATCYIKFTSGDKTRTLDSKTADSNGTVTWRWDTSDAGFSSGSWQISALASLNGQTRTVSDTRELVIQ